MLNNVSICGRICNDLEIRTTPNGAEVLTFVIACDRDFKDKDGERQTDFVDIVTFNHTASFVSRYFAKGRVAIVNGRLQTRNWEDKDGHKRKNVEVIADSVYFGDSRNNADNNNAAPASNFAPNMDEFEEIEDNNGLPF